MKIFECNEQRGWVECAAPFRCNSQCEKYRAKRISGVKKRRFVCKEDGVELDLLTGFVDGCRIVQLK